MGNIEKIFEMLPGDYEETENETGALVKEKENKYRATAYENSTRQGF